MSSDLLSVSVSGLRVAQSALSTTGHNITNAGVDGYSRQRVIAQTNPATPSGIGYIGNGANVQTIERIVNSYVTEQLRSDTSLSADLDIYQYNVSQLDNLLANASTGLSSGMESFFASVQNGLDDPTSIPARQLILSESQNIADRFNALYSRFETIEGGIDESLRSSVSQVNALTANIAQLNRKISDSQGYGESVQPNDLLDQRDESLRKLSELVSIQVYEQSSGQVNIVIGSGQNIVVGNEARELSLQASVTDPTREDVVFQTGSSSQAITNLLTGGEIGGLLRFRDTVMNDVYNEFGRIAVVMADTFNEVHQQGINLDDEFGGLFFNDVNDPDIAADRVISNSTNAEPQNGRMLLNIADSSQLVASDYEVDMDNGGLFRITRVTDGVEVATGLLPGKLPHSVEFDGLELVFQSGSFVQGDEFKLLPVRTGGRDFSSALVDPQSIAFGSPLLTESSLGNSGTGVIAPGTVTSLIDVDGNPIPLLATAGEMNPPLIVRFNSATSYDILDNSDPGNPQQLDPPIRDQRYVPGISNNLFSTDPNATQVSSGGAMLGLPEGRQPALQAALIPGLATASPPSFVASDFSATSNQFAFDVVISGTQNASSDGTFQVTISGPAITSNAILLDEINAQLGSANVEAYIAENNNLAFRLTTAGYGDITLQNYNGDPDGNGDVAPAAQANTLLGLNISGASFTTQGNANGVSGSGFLSNGYPAEAITITGPAATVGGKPTTQNIFTRLNASAKEIASDLNNVQGVEANAFNYLELSNLNLTRTEPLQLNLNGFDLLEYTTDPVTGNPVLDSLVPDPQTEVDAFNDYLATRINNNSQLSKMGIYAEAGANALTGAAEFRIHSSEGDDFQIGLTAASGQSIDVSDGENPNVSLNGNGAGVAGTLVVGGRLDVVLGDDLALSTYPPNSMIFGDTSSADFAKRNYLGIQVEMTGIPDTGDSFSLGFNSNGASDNRNALALVNLARAGTLNGGVATYSESYGTLVERVGIDTASSKVNADATKSVLEQTQQLRNSVSAVNLDEEAANLIRFEQLYSANTQVISVARDLFDRLINSI
ncbi:flagellar hook-associated protein FlgK [Teredinibacter waterburyi]|uniref:flagellar hook-associated protein FlgK n=1 Tax=Teredinibacter waterburyi TaxID=1500538 RepID=UPI00165F014F|nr:flagellar hook-associated protein FlgK [Teredinibacter waterburyi]